MQPRSNDVENRQLAEYIFDFLVSFHTGHSGSGKIDRLAQNSSLHSQPDYKANFKYITKLIVPLLYSRSRVFLQFLRVLIKLTKGKECLYSTSPDFRKYGSNIS